MTRTSTTPATRIAWPATLAFIVLSCALAWLVALPLWLGDGLAEPSTGVLLPVMMYTPAVAALIVALVMRVPARGDRLRFFGLWPLRPAKRVIWLIVLGWLAPPVLVAISILLSGALGWVQLDFTFAAFAAEIEKALPAGTPVPPVGVIVVAQLASIPLAALFNSLFAFGEEIGWRGWLVPALRPLGTWPALILSGIIWGVWHSPVILLGYNFGRTDISGVLFMIAGCVAWGVLLGWLRLRSASVWPAVIAHGSLNASGGMIVIFAAAQPDLALAGPLGVAGWIVLALVTAVLVVTGQFRNQPELADAPGRLLSQPRP
ncbi:CPBP family intramembrane glutamic endopeptidase [Microbacterium aurantiacum]|uniref:CPBP family intramembrane glutamic endopeptidase n=1 Tax=Microbacterium aurantiacum TaxID=162393 RepID=UPI000C80C89C|nr:CPBP family intramembrane glutamic endopeptidase [Microbacterium aurantiacum]